MPANSQQATINAVGVRDGDCVVQVLVPDDDPSSLVELARRDFVGQKSL
jgi:hypothetical protein